MNISRLLFIGLSLLAVILFSRLWIGTGSFPEVWDLRAQIRAQTLENEQLNARNEQLEMDVLGLGEDDNAIEEHARAELGMIKDSETFYQVVLKEDAARLQLPAPNTGNTNLHVE